MKWLLLIVYVAAVLYVHLRGAVRLRWWRQLIDHSTLMAPLNALMQLCSRAPRTPFVAVGTFPELAAGGRIASHRDPFAGWMRYHLGLCTPGDGRCWIAVDGERHAWCDGGAMLFDETYVHWAVNDGERSRLILLCDIERPMRFRW